MFESQHQRATLFTYPLLFSDKERWPLGVILDESNNTGFKTQRVRHRISIQDRERQSDVVPCRSCHPPCSRLHQRGGDIILETVPAACCSGVT